MNRKLKQLVGIATIVSAVTLLSACGGDSGSGSSADANAGASISTDNDFTFPEVTDDNGTVSVTIPSGPAPTFSARRTLAKGTGSTIDFGDSVVLNYQMYSWSTGELVESSDTLDEPITVRAGITNGIPQYLTKSLLGRQLGDKLQIVFESGMEDLPEYLDSNDAYIVVVELI